MSDARGDNGTNDRPSLSSWIQQHPRVAASIGAFVQGAVMMTLFFVYRSWVFVPLALAGTAFAYIVFDQVLRRDAGR